MAISLMHAIDLTNYYGSRSSLEVFDTVSKNIERGAWRVDLQTFD